VTGHSPLNGYVILNAVAISPNRPSRAVTVGDDSQMSFYLGPKYQWKSKQKEHSGFVSDAAFSPDGNRIVTVGEDRKINLYDGGDGKFIRSIVAERGHTGSILSVGWDVTGEKIVTASADRTVKLWDVEKEAVVRYTSHLSPTDVERGRLERMPLHRLNSSTNKSGHYSLTLLPHQLSHCRIPAC
jgi:WD40 repeat protein